MRAFSFLAAASYQETSKILVHAAISSRIDNLSGLKENIILGKKIPSGTALFPFEEHSKYDIKPSINYFTTTPIDGTEISEPIDIDSVVNTAQEYDNDKQSVEEDYSPNDEELVAEEETFDDEENQNDFE